MSRFIGSLYGKLAGWQFLGLFFLPISLLYKLLNVKLTLIALPHAIDPFSWPRGTSRHNRGGETGLVIPCMGDMYVDIATHPYDSISDVSTSWTESLVACSGYIQAFWYNPNRSSINKLVIKANKQLRISRKTLLERHDNYRHRQLTFSIWLYPLILSHCFLRPWPFLRSIGP